MSWEDAPTGAQIHRITRFALALGICIWDMEKCVDLWKEVFGVKASPQVIKYDTKVILLSIGDVSIELLAPDNHKGLMESHLQKRGEGIHHVAFEVDDIYSTVEKLKAKGIEMIDKQPREGAEGMIAFMHPKSTFGILTEIIQPHKVGIEK